MNCEANSDDDDDNEITQLMYKTCLCYPTDLMGKQSVITYL